MFNFVQFNEEMRQSARQHKPHIDIDTQVGIIFHRVCNVHSPTLFIYFLYQLVYILGYRVIYVSHGCMCVSGTGRAAGARAPTTGQWLHASGGFERTPLVSSRLAFRFALWILRRIWQKSSLALSHRPVASTSSGSTPVHTTEPFRCLTKSVGKSLAVTLSRCVRKHI